MIFFPTNPLALMPITVTNQTPFSALHISAWISQRHSKSSCPDTSSRGVRKEKLTTSSWGISFFLCWGSLYCLNILYNMDICVSTDLNKGGIILFQATMLHVEVFKIFFTGQKRGIMYCMFVYTISISAHLADFISGFWGLGIMWRSFGFKVQHLVCSILIEPYYKLFMESNLCIIIIALNLSVE